MRYLAKCPACGREYDDPLRFRCDCGSPLELKLELDDFTEDRLLRVRSMWRYLRFFPYVGDVVSLGEGWTPLVRLDGHVHLKMDFINPTGSFKDRGSSAVVSTIGRLVRETGGFLAEDSSGNAGASLAAYSAKAGLRARIYVPSSASGHKMDQIRAYGAELVRVDGSREEVAREAMRPEEGKIYVGHPWHPVFRDGMRTLAYEIFEQMGYRAPDRVYVPVSSGTGLMGLLRGFEHLGVDTRVVACQTEAVHPLLARFTGRPYTPPPSLDTLAEALIMTDPPLLDLMVEALGRSGGSVDAVGEDEIARAFLELARKGIYVEPTSAVSLACYRKQLDSGEVDESEEVVLLLTGSGLKTSPRIIERLLGGR